MDTRTLKKLIQLVKDTGIGELEVKSGEECVRISCMPSSVPAMPMVSTHHVHPFASHESPKVDVVNEVKAENKNPGFTVKSPMVGTVYLAPTPGAEPFVSVGQHVKLGETLCLIEAMKMFNKIEADKAGVISARMIDNEQPVEYDQPIFIIETENV